MTSYFDARLETAAKLETPFIAAFNDVCRSHRIFKFGIEITELLRKLHDYIRTSTDVTSHFIRFLPDSALVKLEARDGHPPSLLEFKVQDTLVERDSMFRRIQEEHVQRNQGEPLLRYKQDIFGVEKASLDVYQKLASIGINVIIVAWQTKRQDSDTLRAQYAQRVVTCQVQKPSPALRARGSGTTISNVHFGVFKPVPDFFEQEFGIAAATLTSVAQKVS